MGFAAVDLVAVGSTGVGDAGATVGGGVNVAVAVGVSTGGSTSVGVAVRLARGDAGGGDVAWSSAVTSAPLVANGGAAGVFSSVAGERVDVASGSASTEAAGVAGGVVVSVVAESVVDVGDTVCTGGALARVRTNRALPPPLTTVLATSTRQRPAGKPVVLNVAIATRLLDAVTPNVVMV